MAYFEWNESLDTHVDAMNDEHKVLIDYMNRLYDLSQENASQAEIAEAFKVFAEYTTKHFADEEEYMASIDFPKLDIHRHIHADLLKRVGEFGSEFEKTGYHLTEQFFHFLKFWLQSHIKGIDGQYSPTKLERPAAAG